MIGLLSSLIAIRISSQKGLRAALGQHIKFVKNLLRRTASFGACAESPSSGRIGRDRICDDHVLPTTIWPRVRAKCRDAEQGTAQDDDIDSSNTTRVAIKNMT